MSCEVLRLAGKQSYLFFKYRRLQKRRQYLRGAQGELVADGTRSIVDEHLPVSAGHDTLPIESLESLQKD